MTKALVITASTPIPSRIPCQIPDGQTTGELGFFFLLHKIKNCNCFGFFDMLTFLPCASFTIYIYIYTIYIYIYITP